MERKARTVGITILAGALMLGGSCPVITRKLPLEGLLHLRAQDLVLVGFASSSSFLFGELPNRSPNERRPTSQLR